MTPLARPMTADCPLLDFIWVASSTVSASPQWGWDAKSTAVTPEGACKGDESLARQRAAQGEGLPKPGGDEDSARVPRPWTPTSWLLGRHASGPQQGRLCIDRGSASRESQHPGKRQASDLEVGKLECSLMPGLGTLHPQPHHCRGYTAATGPPDSGDSSGNPHVCGRDALGRYSVLRTPTPTLTRNQLPENPELLIHDSTLGVRRPQRKRITLTFPHN